MILIIHIQQLASLLLGEIKNPDLVIMGIIVLEPTYVYLATTISDGYFNSTNNN